MSEEFVLDLSQVQQPPPGNYLVAVRLAEARTSVAGNKTIFLRLEILEPSEWAGHTMVDSLVMQGNVAPFALQRAYAAVKAIMDDPNLTRIRPEDMVGRLVYVLTQPDPRDGAPRPRSYAPCKS